MLLYKVKTGEIVLDGVFEGYGYSGHGEGRNNPDMESIPQVGPIPVGHYKIGKAFDHPRKGPCVFRLEPFGHTAHGRTGFMIHGDNVAHDASLGCIIAGRTIRHRIRDDEEPDLEVVRE